MTRYRMAGARRWALLVSLCVMVAGSGLGCPVKYVDSYNAQVADEIIRISKRIDLFYVALLETPADRRMDYEPFRQEYNSIEADLRALHLRNSARPLNDESTRQSEIALELWKGYKEDHKRGTGLSDFSINEHMSDLNRVFVAMLKGERAKPNGGDSQGGNP